MDTAGRVYAWPRSVVFLCLVLVLVGLLFWNGANWRRSHFPRAPLTVSVTERLQHTEERGFESQQCLSHVLETGSLVSVSPGARHLENYNLY